MSDKLNEKFEELVTEQKVIVEAGDPMPTVSATVSYTHLTLPTS